MSETLGVCARLSVDADVVWGACYTGARETLGVCAREGVCEQLSCPSGLLCLFAAETLRVVALPDPERLSLPDVTSPLGLKRHPCICPPGVPPQELE